MCISTKRDKETVKASILRVMREAFGETPVSEADDQATQSWDETPLYHDVVELLDIRAFEEARATKQVLSADVGLPAVDLTSPLFAWQLQEPRTPNDHLN